MQSLITLSLTQKQILLSLIILNTKVWNFNLGIGKRGKSYFRSKVPIYWIDKLIPVWEALI